MMSYTMSCTCFVVQRVDVDAAHVAVHADHRRQAGRQVQVRTPCSDRERQQLGDVHGNAIGCAARANAQGRRRVDYRFGMATILGNIQQARIAIARGARRPVQSVTLLAVSRPFGADAVRHAHAAGEQPSARTTCRRRRQDRRAGRSARLARMAPDRALQSNKTRVVAEQFDWVHTVDRLKIAQSLSEQRPAAAAAAGVPAGQHQRRGQQERRRRPPRWPAAHAVAALPRLRLRGLMAIPEPAGDLAAQRAAPRPARAARTAAGERPRARHAFDGHERRSPSSKARRAGARGQGY